MFLYAVFIFHIFSLNYFIKISSMISLYKIYNNIPLDKKLNSNTSWKFFKSNYNSVFYVFLNKQIQMNTN
jgi:hypothetical protein